MFSVQKGFDVDSLLMQKLIYFLQIVFGLVSILVIVLGIVFFKGIPSSIDFVEFSNTGTTHSRFLSTAANVVKENIAKPSEVEFPPGIITLELNSHEYERCLLCAHRC